MKLSARAMSAVQVAHRLDATTLTAVDESAAPALAVGAGDTSFGSVGDSSFEDGIGDSPCAAAGSRKPAMILLAQMGALGGARRPLLRAGTTGNILSRHMS